MKFTPTEKIQNQTKTLELIRPELNLEKWTIWQPAKSKLAPNERVLRREINLPNGNRVTAEVEVGFTNKGALTTEDQRTYYALIQQWEERGRLSQQVPFSIRHLAQRLKKRWGTNVINSITESLVRLRTVPFIWRNSYHDSSTGETIKILDTFNILSELKIVQREKDGVVNKEVGYFKFNDFVLNNLLKNHTKPLLFDVVLSFQSEIAQLLYVYLDLILNDKTIYERRTKELFDDLGLEGKAYRNLSDRKRTLERALKELLNKPITTGRISSIALEPTKDQKDYKLVVRKGTRTAFITAPAERRVEGSESRGEIPTKTPTIHTEDPKLRAQADDLVRHFHRLFHNTEPSHINTKARNQAISLIAQHGYNQARYVVDFAHRVAPETNYNPQTFGGILQYTARALADYEERQHWNQRLAQHHAAEADRHRLEEEYDEYRNQRIDAYLAEHPADMDALIAAKREEFLKQWPQYRFTWTDEQITKQAVLIARRHLAEEIGVESFADYCEQHQSRGETPPLNDNPTNKS